VRGELCGKTVRENVTVNEQKRTRIKRTAVASAAAAIFRLQKNPAGQMNGTCQFAVG